MAVSIPSSSIEQRERGESLSTASERTFKRVFKDPNFSTIKTAADGINVGDVYDSNYVVASYDLERTPGGGGLLTLNLKKKDTTEGEGSEVQPKKDLWSIKAVRNDVSIMAYCGPTLGTHPNRVNIEMWEKETDASLARLNKYRDYNGTEVELQSVDVAIITKKKHGIESVIRFYPLLTRKRVYSSFPPACLEALSYIDTPPSPGGSALAPTGLSGKISQYQWLKVDDSADEDANGDWTRTESWMGIKKTDAPDQSPWDANLYGANRWSMPASNPS